MVIWFGLAIAMLVGAVQFSDLGRFGESVDHMVMARQLGWPVSDTSRWPVGLAGGRV